MPGMDPFFAFSLPLFRPGPGRHSREPAALQVIFFTIPA